MTPNQLGAELYLDKRRPDIDSIRKAAKEVGGSYTGVQKFVRRKKLEQDNPGFAEAARVDNMDSLRVRAMWKTPKGTSTLYTAEQPEADDLAEKMRSAFDSLKPAPSLKKYISKDQDHCVYMPIVDHHLGMRAWGKECGADYDLDIGIQTLKTHAANLLSKLADGPRIVLPNLGDFFHHDNNKNMTPGSGHILDVDGRIYKVMEAGIELTAFLIDAAVQKFSEVVYCAIPGNHDVTASIGLTMGLKQRYLLSDQVKIVGCESGFFLDEFGSNLILCHHGDKAKADRLAQHMAANNPEAWGRTCHRKIWTGHIHHESVKEFPGVTWESFGTLAAKDAYAASHAYSSKRTMKAVTLHRNLGEVARLTTIVQDMEVPLAA